MQFSSIAVWIHIKSKVIVKERSQGSGTGMGYLKGPSAPVWELGAELPHPLPLFLGLYYYIYMLNKKVYMKHTKSTLTTNAIKINCYRRKCAVEVSRDVLGTKERVETGWVESRLKRNGKCRKRRGHSKIEEYIYIHVVT